MKGIINQYQYGCDWDNVVYSSVLAITKFRCLLDESRKHIYDNYVKN